MREIKFRAWKKYTQKYLKADDLLINLSNSSLQNLIGGTFRSTDVVLEQFTGLKDKKGVEIYEGDIICQQMRFVETNGVIFWQEDKARFAVNLDGFITTITKPQEHSYEVIGNIHENPELLEDD